MVFTEKARQFFFAFVFLLLHEGIKAAGCQSFNINYPPMRTLLCPGDNITYTCAFNNTNFSVNTKWSGSGFMPNCCNSGECKQITLIQDKEPGSVNTMSSSCGNLSAVMTNVTNITNISGACYTSVLTIPTPQYFNGTTVTCRDVTSGMDIGSGTLNIQLASTPGPVGNMTVNCTSVDQLTVTWAPPTTGGVPTSYNVTINGSSPVVIADNGSSVYTHTFTNLTNNTRYTVSVVAINCAGSSNGTPLTNWTLEPTSITTNSMSTAATPTPTTTTTTTTTTEYSTPPYWIIAIAVGVILLAVIVAIVICVICCRIKSGKGDIMKQKTRTPPISTTSRLFQEIDGTGGALYLDPKDIDHVKAPGGEMYAMADKPIRTSNKSTKKPTANVNPAGMYEDPKNIQHTTTPAGEKYAVDDKKPKPMDRVIFTPTDDMYAVADGNKKKR